MAFPFSVQIVLNYLAFSAMPSELTKIEIRSILLELAKHLEKICKYEGLDYFIFYGTLLGAVRHSGFIPWDDDFDVVMQKKDVLV